ncbi:uncharacterized protein AAEQ78_019635 [Lycaon pictus]
MGQKESSLLFHNCIGSAGRNGVKNLFSVTEPPACRMDFGLASLPIISRNSFSKVITLLTGKWRLEFRSSYWYLALKGLLGYTSTGWLIILEKGVILGLSVSLRGFAAGRLGTPKAGVVGSTLILLCSECLHCSKIRTGKPTPKVTVLVDGASRK